MGNAFIALHAAQLGLVVAAAVAWDRRMPRTALSLSALLAAVTLAYWWAGTV